MKKILLLLLSILLLGCVTEKQEEGSVDLKPGDKLPKFSVVMNDNSVVSNETLLGRASLIVFFHTECPDCRKGFPAIQQVYEEFGDKVTFVAIGTGEDSEKLEGYWEKNNLTIPYSAQSDRGVFHLFAPNTIPHVFIADKNGEIKFVHADNTVATYEQLKKEVIKVMQKIIN